MNSESKLGFLHICWELTLRERNHSLQYSIRSLIVKKNSCKHDFLRDETHTEAYRNSSRNEHWVGRTTPPTLAEGLEQSFRIEAHHTASAAPHCRDRAGRVAGAARKDHFPRLLPRAQLQKQVVGAV